MWIQSLCCWVNLVLYILMALSIIGNTMANELSLVCTRSVLRGIINVTSRIVKDVVIFYEKGFKQPTNSGKFDKEGKDKKIDKCSKYCKCICIHEFAQYYHQTHQCVLNVIKFLCVSTSVLGCIWVYFTIVRKCNICYFITTFTAIFKKWYSNTIYLPSRETLESKFLSSISMTWKCDINISQIDDWLLLWNGCR